MKVAYFSPLSPQKSGISDYSEELLPKLSDKMDLDLYVDDFKPNNEFIKNNFNIYKINDFVSENKYEDYDHVIYNIGNNAKFHEKIYKIALEHPGIVILHDYAIHHLIVEMTAAKNKNEEYIEEMRYNYGEKGKKLVDDMFQGKIRPIWETGNTFEYPLNKRLMDNAKAIIVHSKYIRDLVKQTNSKVPIKYIPMPTPDVEFIPKAEKDKLRNKYKLSKDKMIFSSFGFISKEKRIDKVISVVKNLKKEFNDFLYLLVGREAEGYNISKYIKENNIERYVKIIGFVELDEFKDYIKLSDFCINLRYPTQGETSASLVRILGMGKPAIVTDIGTFSEYPDNCTLKVSYGANEEEDIYNAIKEMINDKNKLKKMSNNAYEYVKENHRIESSAQLYVDLLKDIELGKVYKGNVDAYVDIYQSVGNKLYEIGIDEKNEETLLSIAEVISGLV
ncbi:glycosyltransferase family 4 protein [Orenia marismortui]|uniref:glycosyltransferase family 4 protein n=1 Tax=Orenia marismortui TaxID=46469 RepID=UPI000369714A|nr:glycosyltransferase family 4 protein [Orenia marismortui]